MCKIRLLKSISIWWSVAPPLIPVISEFRVKSQNQKPRQGNSERPALCWRSAAHIAQGGTADGLRGLTAPARPPPGPPPRSIWGFPSPLALASKDKGPRVLVPSATPSLFAAASVAINPDVGWSGLCVAAVAAAAASWLVDV